MAPYYSPRASKQVTQEIAPVALWAIWAYASGVMEAYRGETREVLDSYLDHQITFSEWVFAMEEALARLKRRELLRECDSALERKSPARAFKRSASATG